jgi:hypothetical protein
MVEQPSGAFWDEEKGDCEETWNDEHASQWNAIAEFVEMVLGVVVDHGADDAAKVDIERKQSDHDSIKVSIERCFATQEIILLSKMCRCRFTAIHGGEDYEESIREPQKESADVKPRWRRRSDLQCDRPRAQEARQPQRWFATKVRAKDPSRDGRNTGSQVHQTGHKLLYGRLVDISAPWII